MLPDWLRSPILRSDAWLVSLTGEVRDHGDHLSVHSPDNPGYRHGNHLLLPRPPTAAELGHWLDRARAVFGPEMPHACLVWEGGPLDDDARAEAAALDGLLDAGLAMVWDGPVPAPRATTSGAWPVVRLPDEDDVGARNAAWDPGEAGGSEGYRAFKEGLHRAWASWRRTRQVTWYGALHPKGAVVGQCGLATFEGAGRLQSVETHPDHRRQGVCTSLLTAVRRAAAAAGLDRLWLSADPEGPARGLYTRLGFRPVHLLESLVVGGGQELAVRPETVADHADVRAITAAAFDPDVAARVDSVRGPADISLVAVQDGTLLGHVLFTPVPVQPQVGSPWGAVALALVSVRPSQHGRGIGRALIEAGLEACREAGHGVCFVRGSPAYYPRFGFEPAAAHGLQLPQQEALDPPSEALLVLELRDGALPARGGVVQYPPAFGA